MTEERDEGPPPAETDEIVPPDKTVDVERPQAEPPSAVGATVSGLSDEDAPSRAGLHALTGALLVALALYLVAPIEFVWSVRLLDSVVITAALAALLTVAALAVMLASRGSPISRRIESVIGRFDTLTIVTGVAAVLALFAAYGSFRNQTRLTSEGQLGAEAMILYELEMDNVELRCLYDNYGFPEYETCLNRVTADGEKWSLAIFYVEEGWFVLTQSYQDRKNWGSTYADLIDYWREDVEKDPTGVFTYYQVASTDPRLSDRKRLAAAEEEMDRAGVVIPREEMCRRYQRVRQALERHHGQSKDRNVCGSLGRAAPGRVSR